MPDQPNVTNIPSARVEVIDPRTGLISREWYRFFFNLFNLAGSGGNQISLDDLQVGPPSQPVTGAGTVTSVGLALPTFMAVSGSPVTASGTLIGALVTQSVNTLFAGPSSGGAADPTFRALATADIPSAALNKVDDTNVTMTLSGSPSTALIAATTMELGWTGQLAVSRGGTGVALTTSNFVFAGPASGSPAAPTFRALTTSDLSSLGYVVSVSGTAGRVTSTGGIGPIIDLASGVITAGTTGSITAIPVITVDTYGRVTNITTAANPQGTVTSVALALPSIMSVSGSPVTSSGTLTGALTTQAVNTVFAGPSSGAAAAPTFRALTTADIPALGGATISNDTTTATNLFPLFATATSGALTSVNTGNANLLYKPSTGELTSSAMISSNGIQINSKTVATSYTIATGNNGLSAGPVSVSTGITVTVSTGSTWTVV